MPPTELGVLKNVAAGTYAGATQFTAEVKDALLFLRDHGLIEAARVGPCPSARVGGFQELHVLGITEKGRDYLARVENESEDATAP